MIRISNACRRMGIIRILKTASSRKRKIPKQGKEGIMSDKKLIEKKSKAAILTVSVSCSFISILLI